MHLDHPADWRGAGPRVRRRRCAAAAVFGCAANPLARSSIGGQPSLLAQFALALAAGMSGSFGLLVYCR